MPWIDLPLPVNCGAISDSGSTFGTLGLAPSRRAGGAAGLTPGLSSSLSPWSSTVATTARGLIADTENAALWAVVGTDIHHYLNSGAYTKTVLAATLSGSHQCRLVDCGTHVVVVDHHGADTRACTKSPVAVSTVVPPAGSFRDVTYQDGYTIYSRDGTDEFYISALDDPTTIGALDFSTADALPGDIVGLISDHRELVIFKEGSIEFWANTGGTFPFSRSQPGVAEVGCMARSTIRKYGNAVYWVGSDAHVYRMGGYQPQRISVVDNGGGCAVDITSVGISSQEALFGSIISVRGTTHYTIGVDGGDYVCAYDIERGIWSEYYYGQTLGPMAAYRPSGYTEAVTAGQIISGGTHYVLSHIGNSVDAGAAESNRLETADNAYIYGGVALRLAPIVLPRRATMAALEIEVRNTSSPTYRLYMMDDDGAWTTTPMTATPFGSRVRFTRLGGFRRRWIEIYIGWDPTGAPDQLVTDEITAIRALIDVGE